MSGDIAELYGGHAVDTSNVPEEGFDLIPPGWYKAMIERAEVRNTKSGGKMLWMQLSIVEEKHNNRKVFVNINIVNDSPKAQEIGARELAQLGSACGLLRLGDTSELIDRVILIRIAIESDKHYGDDNRVKAFKAAEGAVPQATYQPPATTAPAPIAAPAATAAPPPATATQAPATGKMPWERN